MDPRRTPVRKATKVRHLELVQPLTRDRRLHYEAMPLLQGTESRCSPPKSEVARTQRLGAGRSDRADPGRRQRCRLIACASGPAGSPADTLLREIQKNSRAFSKGA